MVNKMINVKKEILNAVKNAKFEGAHNFRAGDCFNNCDSVDMEISFDLAGKHIVFEKEVEIGTSCRGGDGDEYFEEMMLDKDGMSWEDFDKMDDDARDELIDRWYADYEAWAEEHYLGEMLMYFFEDLDEQDFINKMVAEYINEHIDDFYEVRDAGYAMEIETNMSAVFVFGDFIGYIIADYFDKDNLDVDLEVFEKKYVKVGKILSETGDKVEYEMYWKCLDLAVCGDNKWIFTKDWHDDIYDIKIDENGVIFVADFESVAAKNENNMKKFEEGKTYISWEGGISYKFVKKIENNYWEIERNWYGKGPRKTYAQIYEVDGYEFVVEDGGYYLIFADDALNNDDILALYDKYMMPTVEHDEYMKNAKSGYEKAKTYNK